MADISNEAVAPEKKESARKSSSKNSGAKSSNRSGSAKSSGKSGSNRSAASRNSSARNNSNRGGNRNNSGGRGRGANSTANKVYKHSPIALACYALAALMLLYACYTGGSTVRQINEYYASYEQSASAGEYIMYVSQAVLDQLIHAFTFFMAGYILTAVRKLDPKNYVSKKPAKKPAAKKEDITVEYNIKQEKAETKTAKAAADTKKKVDSETKTAKEEFEESLEAELKKEEEKA